MLNIGTSKSISDLTKEPLESLDTNSQGCDQSNPERLNPY